MNIGFILGAGFSVNAGLPTAKEINERLNYKPLSEKVLYYGSGEWGWYDLASKPNQFNGKIHYFPRIPVTYILDEILTLFNQQRNKKEFSYESYLQWVSDSIYDEKVYSRIKQNVNKILKNNYSQYDWQIDSIPKSSILSCPYHLIDDLLIRNKKVQFLQDKYKPYLDVIKNQTNSVFIYTLNHDLLLERFFEYSDISYSDGFSILSSELFYNEKIPIFDNSFDERIKLMKLHGSIHYYRYPYTESRNIHKGYDYFKTLDYYEKQTATHIDKISNEPIQMANWDIIPKIVTGDNKKENIINDKMFGILYDNFKKGIFNIDKLIIVGYSFSDFHINEVLEMGADTISEIVNINPNNNYKRNNVRHINPLLDSIAI